MTDPIQDVLKGLRREYLRDAPAKVAEARALLSRLEAGDAVALAELRRALHKLAGSGGSYGFEAVSSASRTGERIAKAALESQRAATPQDVAALKAVIDDVGRAFDDAIRQEPRAEDPPH